MTDQEMKRNRWIDSVRNFIFSMLGMLILFWFAGWRSSKHEFEVKLDSKADIEYVDKAIETHEQKQALIIEAVISAIETGNKNIEKLLGLNHKNLDKRLERIENKQ